jgi:tetratricopeptide (TPR) repeat protein
MDIFTPASAETIFDAVNNQSANMESLANQSLSTGINKYVDKDYKGAALAFQQAFGLAPYSDYAVDAAKYLAMSQLKLGKTNAAIQAYKQAIQVHPNDDTLYTALGNLYFGQGRTGEAITAYEDAVRNYEDGNNRFSLGQAYLKAGRYEDAATQFSKVIDLNQSSANGYFGLGQALAAQKKYPEAIKQFERAVQKNKEFYDAYAEMGYTYADAGNIEKAEEIQEFLAEKDESLADTLNEYINKMTQPKILFAWADSSFSYYLPPKTAVAGLSDYMANANASQSFSMLFQFNKSMDRESVENPTNWTITRAAGDGPGMDYNFGLEIADTEARISPYPSDIYYDEKYYTALVRFTINQNSAGNATIDPSHLEFTFKGIDGDGNTMHPKYDQYMGFSGSI